MKKILSILLFPLGLIAAEKPIGLFVYTNGLVATPTQWLAGTFLAGTNIVMEGTNSGRQIYIHGTVTGGGDVTQAGQNNFTGSNSFGSNTTFIRGIRGTNGLGSAGQVWTTDGESNYWSNAGAGDVTQAQLNSASNSLSLQMTNHVELATNNLKR